MNYCNFEKIGDKLVCSRCGFNFKYVEGKVYARCRFQPKEVLEAMKNIAGRKSVAIKRKGCCGKKD